MGSGMISPNPLEKSISSRGVGSSRGGGLTRAYFFIFSTLGGGVGLSDARSNSDSESIGFGFFGREDSGGGAREGVF